MQRVILTKTNEYVLVVVARFFRAFVCHARVRHDQF